MTKFLILSVFALLFSSCSPWIVSPSLKSGKCVRIPDKTYSIRYGDDRFHDDGELIDEFYAIYGSDTVHVYTKQRVRNSNPTKYIN